MTKSPNIAKDKIKIGKEAEQKARLFLEQKGYVCIAQNYRFGKGEIDLIMQKQHCLVFVEVRSLRSAAFGFPEETISAKKKNLLQRTAENFIFEKNWQKNIRFDVVAILEEQIEHFEDAIV
jgi:putative endonuclease